MNNLIACNDCDLMHTVRPLPEGGVAFCSRCGSVLYRSKRNPLDRTLAMALTGLVLFVLANTFPFLAMKSAGIVRETTLFTGILELYDQKMQVLAALVMLTSQIVPLIEILGLLYIFVPLKFDRRPWKLALVWRCLTKVRTWSMMEVFMLGILVSLVKLAKLATIVPGIAVYAFALLIFVLAAASASLDPRLIWDALDKP